LHECPRLLRFEFGDTASKTDGHGFEKAQPTENKEELIFEAELFEIGQTLN
jgi:hypothetical protein